MAVGKQLEFVTGNQTVLAFQGHRQDPGFPKARDLGLVSAPGKRARGEVAIEGL